MNFRPTAALAAARGARLGSRTSTGGFKALLLAATACGSGLLVAPPAQAQGAQISEVIVTARKRQESILNVPVIETAVPQANLERVQVKDVRDLARFVPGLSFGTAPGPAATTVSLRGVGTTATDPSVEQSITLVVDGFSFVQGMAYSSSMFDVGQVEVLKGPQSLFYGKAATAGVIAVRTADPTDRFEMMVRGGYEFEAREARGEFVLSGPLSDTVKMRLSTMYTHQRGFFRNAAIPLLGTGAAAPKHKHDERKGYIFRWTTLWDPTDRFSARLKVNLTHDHWFNSAIAQWVSCPEGLAGTVVRPGVNGGQPIPFLGGGEDCKLDRTGRVVDIDPAAFPAGLWFRGVPQLKNDQRFGSLELNYKLSPELTLTSVTGYNKSKGRTLFQGGTTAFAGTGIAVQNIINRRDFTQEFRLNSEFDAPINFTAGAYYQDSRIYSVSNIVPNVVYGLPINTFGIVVVPVKTYSAFGQLRWQLTPQLEVAGGARYTDERRKAEPANRVAGVDVPVVLRIMDLQTKNWSPELTVSYRPTDTLTIFGSLKQGYKSGSFSFGAPLVNGGNIAFDDERVRGGEIGLRSRLLDRRLAVDLAAFSYRYTDLQVGATEVVNNIPASRTLNAGSARSKGFEWELAYRPEAVEGLGLYFSGAYTRARYLSLNNVPCFGGQTIAQGCNQLLNPLTGLFTAQSLSGTPLVRAPKWQFNWGFDYERPLDNGMTVVFTNSNQYSGKYLAFLGPPDLRPDFVRPSYTKVNASLALKGPEDRWEVALIGNNIFNKLTAGNCSNANGQNTTSFGAAGGLINGGVTRGAAGVDEVVCRVDRGREVWVRFTFRPRS